MKIFSEKYIVKTYSVKMPSKITYIEFRIRLAYLFPDWLTKYPNLSNYEIGHSKMSFDGPYGRCHRLPYSILRGFAVNIESAIDKTAYWVAMARNTHGDLFGYPNTIYVNARTRIKIECKIHGEFTQKPSHHIDGSGCPTCAIEERGYSNWIPNCKKCKKCKPLLYVIRCWDDEDEFYKVGKTFRSVYHRYGKKKSSRKTMPYNYEIIQEVFGTCEQVHVWERDLHRLFKKMGLSQCPKLKFEGKTECYKMLKTIYANS